MTDNFDRMCGLLLLGALLAGLALFLDKAFHLDDPMFLWVAERMARDPLHSYAGVVNWFGIGTSVWVAHQHPPLLSAFFAALLRAGVSSEFGLHLAMLPISAACAALAYRLAAAFRAPSPLWVAAGMASAPAFFVSATTLMADVPLLALVLGALLCWDGGLRRSGGGRLLFAAAGLLAAMAGLTKYFGAVLLALLPLLSWARRGRLGREVWALAIPIAAWAAWNGYSWSQGGGLHMLGAAGYAAAQSSGGWGERTGIALGFLGGSFGLPLFLLPLALVRFRWRGTLIAAVALAILGWHLWAQRLGSSGASAWALAAWIWMAAAGAAALALGCGFCARAAPAGETGRVSRDGSSFFPLPQGRREKVFLWAWVAVTFAFAAWCNWTVSVRALLPALPPLLILLSLRWGAAHRAARWLAAAMAAALSLWVAAADADYARGAREIALATAKSPQARGRGIHFGGHWGFQLYMERMGFKAFDYARRSPIPMKDLIIIPIRNNHNGYPVAGHEREVARRGYPNRFRMAAMSYDAQAGFYCSTWGILPFNLTRAPSEEYVVWGGADASPPSLK